MRTPTEARSWIEDLPDGTFFSVRDVPGTQRAAQSLLSRLAVTDGPVRRVKPGLYWKKPPATRFGTAKPLPRQAAYAAVRTGIGPSDVSAANDLGLSTQVPVVTHVAVVGRAPKGLTGVRFQTRSNPSRHGLSPTEIAVLEVLRLPETYFDVPWDRVVQKVRDLDSSGRISLDQITAAAAHEHNALVRHRLADLATTP